MVGRVIATKMAKTVTVLVEMRKQHPLYKKTFMRTKKYLVDDPFGVKIGDIVIAEKVRPISKRKHWQITKVLGQDTVSIEEAMLKEKVEEAIAEVMPAEPVEPVKSVESDEIGESVKLVKSEKTVRKTKKSDLTDATDLTDSTETKETA